MMIAADYVLSNSNMEGDSPRKRMEEFRRIEEKMFQIVMADLLTKDFKWTMDKPEGRMRFPDLVVNIEDVRYKRWFLKFKPIQSVYSPHLDSIHNFSGRLLTFELLPTDKFTLVVNDERVLRYLLNRPPVNLRANFYVMLVDLESGRVLTEEKLSKY